MDKLTAVEYILLVVFSIAFCAGAGAVAHVLLGEMQNWLS